MSWNRCGSALGQRAEPPPAGACTSRERGAPPEVPPKPPGLGTGPGHCEPVPVCQLKSSFSSAVSVGCFCPLCQPFPPDPTTATPGASSPLGGVSSPPGRPPVPPAHGRGCSGLCPAPGAGPGALILGLPPLRSRYTGGGSTGSGLGAPEGPGAGPSGSPGAGPGPCAGAGAGPGPSAGGGGGAGRPVPPPALPRDVSGQPGPSRPGTGTGRGAAQSRAEPWPGAGGRCSGLLPGETPAPGTGTPGPGSVQSTEGQQLRFSDPLFILSRCPGALRSPCPVQPARPFLSLVSSGATGYREQRVLG